MCNKLKNINRLLFFLLAGLIFAGCAKVASLSGGPKDVDPPRVILARPTNYNTSFDQRRIEIYFDEFVQLKNATSEMVISPPLDNKPLIKLKGRSILIDLDNNELKKNTTYTINFGNAIVDNNEGNVLKNFEYVFSTREYLDSLSIKGNLLWAFDLLPPKEKVSVFLYDEYFDSVPYLKRPLYLARTDENGYFAINNIKDTTYKVFALKDANNNLLFDLPNEPIAFLDTTIHLTHELTLRWDSLSYAGDTLYLPVDTMKSIDDTLFFPVDTLKTIEDTLINDSIKNQEDSLWDLMKNRFFINLFLFEEVTYNQYILEAKRKTRKLISIAFNEPVDSFSLDPLYYENENFCIEQFNKERDTIHCWITDTSMINSDTLSFFISYLGKDSAGQNMILKDTINSKFKEQPKKTLRGRRQEAVDTVEIENVQLTTNIKSGGYLDLNKNIIISSEYPVDSVNKDKIHLLQVIDSLEQEVSFSLNKDSFQPGKFYMDHSWMEDSRYKLLVEPGAFENIYDLPYDSLEIPFITRGLDYYGKIIANIQNVDTSVIVQLLQKKNEMIVQEIYLSRDQVVSFGYLPPGDYLLKIIFDRNQNKKWDTGDYSESRQPELVKYYPETMNIKSNWDFEISWDVEH